MADDKPDATALGGLSGALSGALGAFKELQAAIQSVVSVTQGWVQSLAPGLIQQFNRSLDNVNATIGQAFTGIFEQGINFLERLAGLIDPIFAALKPVVDQLVTTSIKNLTGVMQAVAGLFSALAPVLRTVAIASEAVGAILRPLVALIGGYLLVSLAPLAVLFALLNAALKPALDTAGAVLNGLAGVIQTLTTIFGALVESVTATLTASLGLDVTDVVKSVKDAFAQLREAVVLTVARFALFFGATDFVKRLRDALSPGAGQEAAGATSTKNLEQIGKDFAQASINAAGSTEEGEADPNAAIVGKLDALIKSSDSGNSFLERLVNLLDASRGAAASAARDVGKFLDDPVGYVDADVKKRLGVSSWNPF